MEEGQEQMVVLVLIEIYGRQQCDIILIFWVIIIDLVICVYWWDHNNTIGRRRQ